MRSLAGIKAGPNTILLLRSLLLALFEIVLSIIEGTGGRGVVGSGVVGSVAGGIGVGMDSVEVVVVTGGSDGMLGMLSTLNSGLPDPLVTGGLGGLLNSSLG